MPAASSGSGAPKVGPLSVPSPVSPLPSHSVSEVPSQLLRQYLSVEPWITGKLCEVPVQPLSRSLPVDGVCSVIWFGKLGSSVRSGQPLWGSVHWTGSTFANPFALSCSLTFFDGSRLRSGLVGFFGTRLSARFR